MISCILLAAGESARFGSPKALARLNGVTIIEHLQKELLSSYIDELVIVTGAAHERIKTVIFKHEKVKVVYNKDYNLGQTTSVKTGLKSIAPAAKGLILLPVDFPLVKSMTINFLIQYFLTNPALIIIPTYNGHKGNHPVYRLSLMHEMLA